MTKEEISALVAEVTQEVLRSQGSGAVQAPGEGKRLLFICKGACELPERLAAGYEVCLMEDYEACQDITRYDLVVIGHLSTAQLTDLALARMADPVSCAVLHALLAGIDVFLLDGALSYRKYEGKGSPALYQKLNEYEHTLQIYGIKLYVDRHVKQVEIAANPAHSVTEVTIPQRAVASQAVVQVGTAQPNAQCVITEADAVSLIAQLQPGETSIQLDRGAILTPAARDVFLHSNVEVL